MTGILQKHESFFFHFVIQITVIFLSTSMINRFLKAGYVKKYSLSSLKVIHCGGAIIKPKTQKEMRRILPHVQMLQSYGRYHSNVMKYYKYNINIL